MTYLLELYQYVHEVDEYYNEITERSILMGVFGNTNEKKTNNFVSKVVRRH